MSSFLFKNLILLEATWKEARGGYEVLVEGDSHVEWFEGNYQDYEADRHRRLGPDADQPHRIKYKPLAKK